MQFQNWNLEWNISKNNIHMHIYIDKPLKNHYLVHFIQTFISKFQPFNNFRLNLSKFYVLNLQDYVKLKQEKSIVSTYWKSLIYLKFQYIGITQDMFKTNNFGILVAKHHTPSTHWYNFVLPFVLSYLVDHQSGWAVVLVHVSFSTMTSLCLMKLKKKHWA